LFLVLLILQVLVVRERRREAWFEWASRARLESVSRAVDTAGADAVRAMLFPFTCERDKYQCPAAGGVLLAGRCAISAWPDGMTGVWPQLL